MAMATVLVAVVLGAILGYMAIVKWLGSRTPHAVAKLKRLDRRIDDYAHRRFERKL